MTYLLRVELPDVPGSLGALATALGGAGADIEAIEVVDRDSEGRVIDDVLLELGPTLRPDALITACHQLDGVSVRWISRYTAGASLSRDLEAVEAFTEDPDQAIRRLVEVIPSTFRVDWAMAVRHEAGHPSVLAASATAPELVDEAAEWLLIGGPMTLSDVPEWDSTVLAASPGSPRVGRRFVVVVGRHGGPAFLTSEVARLGHIVSLAASVQTT